MSALGIAQFPELFNLTSQNDSHPPTSYSCQQNHLHYIEKVIHIQQEMFEIFLLIFFSFQPFSAILLNLPPSKSANTAPLVCPSKLSSMGSAEGLCLISHCAPLKGETIIVKVTTHLVGLVVKASASRAEDPGFESYLHWDFSGSSHTSDLKIGTLVATLTGAWRYRVSSGTGWPGISIL